MGRFSLPVHEEPGAFGAELLPGAHTTQRQPKQEVDSSREAREQEQVKDKIQDRTCIWGPGSESRESDSSDRRHKASLD
jgi:hypothetical protein